MWACSLLWCLCSAVLFKPCLYFHTSTHSGQLLLCTLHWAQSLDYLFQEEMDNNTTHSHAAVPCEFSSAPITRCCNGLCSLHSCVHTRVEREATIKPKAMKISKILYTGSMLNSCSCLVLQSLMMFYNLKCGVFALSSLLMLCLVVKIFILYHSVSSFLLLFVHIFQVIFNGSTATAREDLWVFNVHLSWLKNINWTENRLKTPGLQIVITSTAFKC